MNRSLVLLGSLFACSAVCAQRLPKTAVPDSYDLQFEPDLAQATFTGEETIHVRLTAPTATIVLNSAELEIKSASVVSAKNNQNADVSLDADKEQATLTLHHAIPSGSADIHLRFSGILNDKLLGFYLSQTPRRRYAVTQFEATEARRAFPCFDEPEYKAVFRLRLIVDGGDTAISAGRIVGDNPAPNGKHVLTFSATPKISTYLMSMIVGDFSCRQGSADNIPIRVCAIPEKAALTEYALRSSERIVRDFDSYFYTKYPFEKLDIIAFPDFSAGAMENVAAITYRETLLLVDEKRATIDLKAFVPQVLAHEIAHQWFGDLVTMNWWDDLWLSEGFATWAAWKPVKAWNPEWHSDLGEIQQIDGSLGLDGVASIRAIRTKAETPAEIRNLFDGIAYGKAASVLRMMEAYLGPGVFQKGVNNYLRKHAYANASSQDFFKELTLASGKPADKVMASFINQPGAPLVSIKIDCESGNSFLALTQQRYFDDHHKLLEANNQLWEVPVTLSSDLGNPITILLTASENRARAASCPAWLLANPGGIGYYRSEYSPEIFRKLVPLLSSHLSAAERIRFLGDSWSLVQVGRLNIEDYLNSLKALEQEKERAVVGTLLQNLSTIHDFVSAPEDRAAFEQWSRLLLRNLALQVTPETGEGEDRRALRNDIESELVSVAEDPESIARALATAQAYMTDPKSVPPAQAGLGITTAAQHGDVALFDKYIEHMKNAHTMAEFYLYLSSLTKFPDPSLISRTFDLFLSSDVRVQDLSRLNPILVNPKTQQVAWEQYKAHFPQIRAKAGGALGAGFVAIAGVFCDPELRDDAQAFFAGQNIEGAERILRNSLDRANSCIQLRTLQRENLSRFLRLEH